MGKQGPKASNIYQLKGIANNKGVVEPKLPGVGSPGKFWPAVMKMAPKLMGMMGGKGGGLMGMMGGKGGKEEGGGGTKVNVTNTNTNTNTNS